MPVKCEQILIEMVFTLKISELSVFTRRKRRQINSDDGGGGGCRWRLQEPGEDSGTPGGGGEDLRGEHVTHTGRTTPPWVSCLAVAMTPLPPRCSLRHGNNSLEKMETSEPRANSFACAFPGRRGHAAATGPENFSQSFSFPVRKSKQARASHRGGSKNRAGRNAGES